MFALSGGLLAVQKRFDLFGVLLFSFVVAVTGGITRDLLIGAVSPAAVASWHTLAIAAFGGLLTFTSTLSCSRTGATSCSSTRSASPCSPPRARRKRRTTGPTR